MGQLYGGRRAVGPLGGVYAICRRDPRSSPTRRSRSSAPYRAARRGVIALRCSAGRPRRILLIYMAHARGTG